jgi:uncharacterized protein (UPF0335 family)
MTDEPNIHPTDDLVKETCAQIEALYGELETLKGEYMEQCKELREQMQDTYADAKSRGVDTKALKAVVKIRKLERKIGAIEEGDVGEAYDNYRAKIGHWGETPLAKAAS